jgi:hypothetical protein
MRPVLVAAVQFTCSNVCAVLCWWELIFVVLRSVGREASLSARTADTECVWGWFRCSSAVGFALGCPELLCAGNGCGDENLISAGMR